MNHLCELHINLIFFFDYPQSNFLDQRNDSSADVIFFSGTDITNIKL
jgi:hypothetical protein